MILYKNDGMSFFFNIFQKHGSVFPKALLISIPSSLVSTLFVYIVYNGDSSEYFKDLEHFKDKESVLNNNAIWGGFTFCVSFLVVFRTSQSYLRFWEGATQTHKMSGEWYDACSSLIAFCKHSQAETELVFTFQNLLVRLFSMLHAAALSEIEDCGVGTAYDEKKAFNVDLIDAEAIDADSMRLLHDCDTKVELIFQWIQQLVVMNIKNGVLSIPPPILSRSFQELATGMVHFHESLKLSNVPFPFPYTQTCDCLLVLHWLILPFVVSQWATKPWWAGLFSFLQVFTLWSLNLIAVELENPFGNDANDLDSCTMQLAMNNSLRLLLRSTRMSMPICQRGSLSQRKLMDRAMKPPDVGGPMTTFNAVWDRLGISVKHKRSYRARLSLKRSSTDTGSSQEFFSRASAEEPRGSIDAHPAFSKASMDSQRSPLTEDVGHWEALSVENQHVWTVEPSHAYVAADPSNVVGCHGQAGAASIEVMDLPDASGVSILSAGAGNGVTAEELSEHECVIEGSAFARAIDDAIRQEGFADESETAEGNDN